MLESIESVCVSDLGTVVRVIDVDVCGRTGACIGARNELAGRKQKPWMCLDMHENCTGLDFVFDSDVSVRVPVIIVERV